MGDSDVFNLEGDEFLSQVDVSQPVVRVPSNGRFDPCDGYARQKCVRDNVHGNIFLDPVSVAIIDTPEFQRLRDVKQLGLCYQVYPGAVHTRFEHSLGVYRLCERAYTELKATQRRESDLEPLDGQLIRLAGLCHDLGHGPFSHVFDNVLLKNADVVNNWPELRGWKHEQMSARLLEHIVDTHGIGGPLEDRNNLRRVQDYILASSTPSVCANERSERRYLFDIVANGRNNIDVDKFDYIERDCLNSGTKLGFDFERLINEMLVIDGEICYYKKAVEDVYKLFLIRAELFRTVYTHAKVKAIESMVADALLSANRTLRFMDKANDPKEFWKFDDTLVKRVELDERPELREAQDIIKRIRTRNLYRFCGEYLVPEERLREFTPVREVDITSAGSSNVQIRPEDIVVHNVEVNFGMGDQNPVDRVHFFQDHNNPTRFKISRDQVSTMLPCSFKQVKVLVYCKKPEHHDEVVKLFEKHQRRHFDAIRSTPEKKRRRPLGPLFERVP